MNSRPLFDWSTAKVPDVRTLARAVRNGWLKDNPARQAELVSQARARLDDPDCQPRLRRAVEKLLALVEQHKREAAA